MRFKNGDKGLGYYRDRVGFSLQLEPLIESFLLVRVQLELCLDPSHASVGGKPGEPRLAGSPISSFAPKAERALFDLEDKSRAENDSGTIDAVNAYAWSAATV